MSEVPSELKYTSDHEWVRVDGDTVTVGIDDYAQEALGELVFVELPDVGATFKKGADMAVVESFKTASDVYAPVSGEIVEVNETLNDSPQTVNESPYEDGWLVKIKFTEGGEMEELLEAEAYAATLQDD